MIELLTEIKTRLEVILAGELFDDPAGGQSEPRVERGGLGPKRDGEGNVEDFPFVVPRSISGRDSDRSSACTIRLLAGVYTNDSGPGRIVAGQTDLDRLISLICSLRENRYFAGYRLLQDIGWVYGDEDGRQALQYYQATITLEFTRDKKCTEV